MRSPESQGRSPEPPERSPGSQERSPDHSQEPQDISTAHIYEVVGGPQDETPDGSCDKEGVGLLIRYCSHLKLVVMQS